MERGSRSAMIHKIDVCPTEGNRCDAWDCAVARAINRVCAEGVEAAVCHHWVNLHKGFAHHRIEFSSEVHDKIAAIDRGDVVPPFHFVLDIPLGYHKPVGITKEEYDGLGFGTIKSF